jgi:carbon-monoxide dehydrogenase large subunit
MSITGMEYDSGSLIESLDKVCDEADYQAMRKLQEEARSEGRMVGIGVSVFTEQTAPPADKGLPLNFSWDAATVRMDPSGKVVVQAGTHSHGQGHETTLAQIVADELTLPLADVRIAFGDTESTPNGIGTFASRSAVVAGSASYLAAASVKKNLRERAAHLLEASVDDVELDAGRLSIKGAPQQSLSVAEVARISYHHPEQLDPSMEPMLEAVATFNAGPGTYANSAQIALVEVDAETGRFKILRYLVVEDCGQMINPTIVDGQVHGGIAQGLGGALFEELIYDENAQLLTTTFLDYLMPGATDIPNIEVSHLVTPSAFVPNGIKGMGEGGAVAPGAVLACAIEDAIKPIGEVFVDRTPLTPERVVRFIEAAAGGGAE